MKLLFSFGFMLCFLAGCSQQNINIKQDQKYIRVGGGCEGCEAIYESPVPFAHLNPVDTLPDFHEPGPKTEISGIVYHRDGKTPAKDIILYIYHTDQAGIYPKKGNETGWAKRHGYLRGWVKTNKNGYYQFFTLRPAAYPGRKDPAHIHITIKEPDKNEYWIDEFLFADDPLLTDKNLQVDKHRGGNGIIKPVVQNDGITHGTRHIFLGLNVPDYPYQGLPKINSGLAVGDVCPAFEPLHLSGADSGKIVNPVNFNRSKKGIMLWFNHANLEQMASFAKKLDNEIKNHGENNLLVFLVYMNPFYKQNSQQGEVILGRKIRQWCDEEGLKKVSMLWVPNPIDKNSCGLYKINPEAKNTVFVYENNTIISKQVNIEYDEETLNAILNSLK